MRVSEDLFLDALELDFNCRISLCRKSCGEDAQIVTLSLESIDPKHGGGIYRDAKDIEQAPFV